MTREELGYWLRLMLTPGVGSETARKLMAHFGLPQDIFNRSQASLAQVVRPAVANALLEIPPNCDIELENTWQWLASSNSQVQKTILKLGDASYPPQLLNIPDPPVMLYATGQVDRWVSRIHSPALQIAVVGSRNPTAQGLDHARHFSKALTEAGLVVTSGLALGIDGAAHWGALSGTRSQDALATIAVVGTGLDRVYPKQHHALAHEISQNGLLLSEYPLGSQALSAHFPRRNRLICGLSAGALVVEANLNSGSLITARIAADQGKEVFAIPGSINSPQSKGCHALIRQGAKLVECVEDILQDLRINALLEPASSSLPHQTDQPQTAKSTHPVLDALGFDPINLDTLLARTGLDTAALNAQLLELELTGQIARLPGGLFQARSMG